MENFCVEAPGLFVGRGEHPRRGTIKRRVYPTDVEVNIGSEDPIPKPPCEYEGMNWKQIIHDNTSLWLARWLDWQGKQKEVRMSPTSRLGQENCKEKFNQAQKLGHNIKAIRAYEAEWLSDDRKTRQVATALYFVDRLALRVGNEKGKGEGDSVGCCTLKVSGKTCYFFLNSCWYAEACSDKTLILLVLCFTNSFKAFIYK